METPTVDECRKAKAFRESLGLTLTELGDLTGYGRQACHLFERGLNSSGRPHDPAAWHRYKMACLALAIMRKLKVKSIEQWRWSKGG